MVGGREGELSVVGGGGGGRGGRGGGVGSEEGRGGGGKEEYGGWMGEVGLGIGGSWRERERQDKR